MSREPFKTDPPPEESRPGAAESEEEGDAQEESSEDERERDYGAPFEARSFGGHFVWAKGSDYEAKILRVRAGQKVAVSTAGRRDMVVMLAGGRGLLEIITDGQRERVELEPLAPVPIEPGREYRLVAVTEVELFTLHSPGKGDS